MNDKTKISEVRWASNSGGVTLAVVRRILKSRPLDRVWDGFGKLREE